MTIKIKMDLKEEMENKIVISTQATDVHGNYTIMHGNYTMQVPQFVAEYFMYQLCPDVPKKEEPVSGRIQIIESETQPDGYAIAYDNDINGDDLTALLARTRRSERERIAAQLERIGIAMSKSHEYSANDTTMRAHALYEASQIIGGTSKHTCLGNPCGRTWFHV